MVSKYLKGMLTFSPALIIGTIYHFQHKFRLLNDITKTTRATYLGPTFGEPVEKILIAGQRKILKNRDYMIFATRKVIGLMILPFDGNPHKILGMIGHPRKVCTPEL